jgi:hypothetical protein
MKLLLALLPLALLVALLYGLVKVLEANKARAGQRADEPPSAAPPDTGPPPYEPRKQGILTDAELRFLPALEQAVAQLWPGPTRIYAQVPMNKVLQVSRGLDNSARQRWHNQIDRRTFDFAITDDRTHVLACVELDDSSHDRPKRRDRDDFVNRACAAADVCLARIPGAAHYDPAAIAQALAPCAERSPRPAPAAPQRGART